jgi:hypothetical protein
VIIATLTQLTPSGSATELVSIWAPFQNIIVRSNVPFRPTASGIMPCIRVDVTWLVSLVLSLTHALSFDLYIRDSLIIMRCDRNMCPRSRASRSLDRLASLIRCLHLSISLFIEVSSIPINIQDCGLMVPRPRSVQNNMHADGGSKMSEETRMYLLEATKMTRN